MGQESKTVARSLAKKRAVWQRRIARWDGSGRTTIGVLMGELAAKNL